MVHFSGKARKMNHIPLRASEASARTSSLDFMYGFETIHKFQIRIKRHFCARFAHAKRGEVVHFSGKARKMNHIPLFARAKRAREPAI
ncbi:MAG: hypothetical protein U5L45_16670 [Saprospiraceae bacterium]|nr:hypothetical protein [Saprospiraceae bacterium]